MRILLALLSFALLSVSSTANAQIEACGVPDDPDMKTEATEYCDIHQRRLAYREKNEEFHNLIQERRENYQAQNQQIRDRYEQDVKTLHGQIGNN